jgi:hypothetical protein
MKNLRHDQWTKHNKTSNVAFFILTGEPQDSGISLQTVLELGPTVPVFGVCMGLQCMGEAFGGESLIILCNPISHQSIRCIEFNVKFSWRICVSLIINTTFIFIGKHILTFNLSSQSQNHFFPWLGHYNRITT